MHGMQCTNAECYQHAKVLSADLNSRVSYIVDNVKYSVSAEHKVFLRSEPARGKVFLGSEPARDKVFLGSEIITAKVFPVTRRPNR